MGLGIRLAEIKRKGATTLMKMSWRDVVQYGLDMGSAIHAPCQTYGKGLVLRVRKHKEFSHCCQKNSICRE